MKETGSGLATHVMSQNLENCWLKDTIAFYFDDSKTHVVCGNNYLKSVFSIQVSKVKVSASKWDSSN